MTKCQGLTRFANNAFENNGDYNVKMGQEQAQDLPVEGNWWGSSTASAVVSGFFDGRREPGIGRVLFEPFLETRPVLVAPAVRYRPHEAGRIEGRRETRSEDR